MGCISLIVKNLLFDSRECFCVLLCIKTKKKVKEKGKMPVWAEKEFIQEKSP